MHNIIYVNRKCIEQHVRCAAISGSNSGDNTRCGARHDDVDKASSRGAEIEIKQVLLAPFCNGRATFCDNCRRYPNLRGASVINADHLCRAYGRGGTVDGVVCVCPRVAKRNWAAKPIVWVVGNPNASSGGDVFRRDIHSLTGGNKRLICAIAAFYEQIVLFADIRNLKRLALRKRCRVGKLHHYRNGWIDNDFTDVRGQKSNVRRAV